jgi:hypothetical protein
MKRYFVTLVAAILCGLGTASFASAQPGPASPIPALPIAAPAKKQAGMTPERLAEWLRSQSIQSTLQLPSKEGDMTIVKATIFNNVNGTKWQLDFEFQFDKDLLVVACPLQDAGKLTARDLLALMQMNYKDMPLNARFSLRAADNKLILETGIMKPHERISQEEVLNGIVWAFELAAKSYPHWSGQKVPSAPVSPAPVSPAPNGGFTAPLIKTRWEGVENYQGPHAMAIEFRPDGVVVVIDNDHGQQQGRYTFQNGTLTLDLGRLRYVGQINGTKIIGKGSFEDRPQWDFEVTLKA